MSDDDDDGDDSRLGDDYKVDLDLGDDHTLQYTCWKPDRELNKQHAHLLDVEKFGAIVRHRKPVGKIPPGETGWCEGYITFAGPVQLALRAGQPSWHVVSWEPLTLTPSLLCGCGDHGFIREGKWVRA